MFVIKDAGYQLLRGRGRSLLLLAVSALLCGCIAFYMGSIISSQRALDTINQSAPAEVYVSNCEGDQLDNLNVSYARHDVLLPWMREVFTTSQGVGIFVEENRPADPFNDAFYENDTTILAVNRWEATGIQKTDFFSLAQGRDISLLEGEEGLCIVSEDYARRMGLAPGDSFTMPVCETKYNSYRSPVQLYISDMTLTVAGTFSVGAATERLVDMYVPVGWFRAQVEQSSGEPFAYTSFKGYLADSMKLNEFKAVVGDYGFYQPFYLTPETERVANLSEGRSILMEDENFIKTAEKLAETVRQFTSFLLPFFLAVVCLVTLAIFLVLRGARRDMAIACSLGRPKGLVGAAQLLAALAAELAGCLLCLPVMIGLARLPAGASASICGAFLLCALAGDLLGLWLLLRFDAIVLLTASKE